jgi:predicted kinase
VSDRAPSRTGGGTEPETPAPIIVVSGPSGVGKSTVAHLVAEAFPRAVHLRMDDFLASVVTGWVDPNLPEADRQNEAIGGALAVSAMGLADNGYTTVVDGHIFPEGAAGLAAACRHRGIACHYAVLAADLETCWERANVRVGGRRPLEFEPFAELHGRFARLDLPGRHLLDATRPPNTVSAAVLAGFRSGTLQ